jgi:glycogen operon protein
LYNVDRLGAFFDIIHKDPVLSQVKLIAEPWDLGEGGYQVGNFPVLWTEWNGRYRDCVRGFWRGDEGMVPELATRLSGSADLYENTGRRPHASINFVTAHDGFTLHDLVSYNSKHNEANGEDNQDGENHNLSWNCGVEGPTDHPAIVALRDRQVRNFMATLFLSQGVPMITAGDELCRTQRGNNNAYCQDNDISWIDWSLSDHQREMLEFVQRLIRLRSEQPALHRRKFFRGNGRGGGREVSDIMWLTPSGTEMTEQEWGGSGRCLGVRLAGEHVDDVDDHGNRIVGHSLLYVLNAGDTVIEFTLPAFVNEPRWEVLVDTFSAAREGRVFAGGHSYPLGDRSVAVLRLAFRERGRP